jgi:hypothetical protein
MGLLDAFSKKKADEEEELELELPEEIEPYHSPVKQTGESPMTEEEQILPHRDGPLFVSVQDYQAILDNLNNMKAKLKEADESFDNLNKLKTEQKAKFDSWRKNLEDVQKKLTYVDEVIFGKI